MVDTARQLLDELMGRNRNLDPTTAKSKKIQWDDPEVSDKIAFFFHRKIVFNFLFSQLIIESFFSFVFIIW